jgi:Contractile injection system tube protein
MQTRKARILVYWHQRNPEPIDVQYNPTEYSLDKQVQLGEAAIPGLDAPLQQFVRGSAEKLTLDLFCDTTEHGMGEGAVSVTTETDRIFQLIRIEPTRHAPPILAFLWGPEFPGNRIVIDQAGQRREAFRCVMESLKQKFTLFSSEGVPLRATLTVSLREYRDLNEQLDQLKLSSPDRTHVHVLQQGDTLAGVARRYYDKPAQWRVVAEANRIEDARRTTPGAFVRVPPLD